MSAVHLNAGGKRKLREFIDKTSGQDGTDINRAALMAIQGFETRSTVFNADGSFTETNALGADLDDSDQPGR